MDAINKFLKKAELEVFASKLPNPENAYTNKAYINRENKKKLFNDINSNCYVLVKGLILSIDIDNALDNSQIAFNIAHRETSKIQLNEKLIIKPYFPDKNDNNVSIVSISISTYAKKDEILTLTDDILEEKAKSKFNYQILTVGQILILKWDEQQALKLIVTSLFLDKLDKQPGSVPEKAFNGLVTEKTQFIFESADENRISLKTKKIMQRPIFRTSFNFEKLGVGGLDEELSSIFRRAFSSRIFPPSIIKELGIKHVKGMLLFGPPGTGKTLIARQIGKALNAKEPIIVNGPEILNKYVGQSEENIRNLFKPAEDEYKKYGDNSALHIIIFDEIDAICKQRGASSSSTGVNDSVVNQLLSKMDGVEMLNNVLIIGMTNRRDLIDEALLRPGRLEVNIEIGLPNENGRLQILKIHTQQMRENNRLDDSVKLETLASETKNFSGAEIEGLVRTATSYAFHRRVDYSDLSKPTNADSIAVTAEDFESSFNDIKPAYGAEEDQFDSCLENGIIEYGEDFNNIIKICDSLIQQVNSSVHTRVLSLLLHGYTGTGKTTISAYIAKKAKFPFMKIISPNQFIGTSESYQIASIAKIFDDAYKSDLSLIVLDDIERLLGYTRIGPRFSNNILQMILTLVKKAPPKSPRKLLIIGTSSESEFCEDSGLLNAFTVIIEIPQITKSCQMQQILKKLIKNDIKFAFDIDQFSEKFDEAKIPIKNLLLAVETASESSKPNPISLSTFFNVLIECGYNGPFIA